MSADKYPCIFSRQMETIVYIFARFSQLKVCLLGSREPNSALNMMTFVAMPKLCYPDCEQ